MSHPRVIRLLPVVSSVIAIAVLVALVAQPGRGPTPRAAAAMAARRACPAGFLPATQDGETSLAGHAQIDRLCVNRQHPESPRDIAALGAQRYAIQAAPGKTIPANAYWNAIQARNRILKKGQSPANRHRWTSYGIGPLQAQDKDYPSVNGLGLVELGGRPTQFAYANDKRFKDTIFVSVAYGGVWKSTDEGGRWTSIGNSLPTQVVGGVGYTPARGGTIVAITGDGSFGRYSRPGAGAFWSTNGGRTWHHSKGVPSDAFGFKVAVDQAHPQNVYVATGAGLFRSTNAGRTFKNVRLPTGKCAGKSARVKDCLLANEVTDVVVQAPGGSAKAKGGAVLAAVGWRDGNLPLPDGKPQSANNGLYYSPTGKPKSFKLTGQSGFVPQANIGRIALGEAYGPQQDHNYVYASVQDAQASQGKDPAIDAQGQHVAVPTVWYGLYVSADFGKTWTQLYTAQEAQNPSTGSALAGTAQATGSYGPGIQSWYNEWVQPDPSLQSGGVPTRVLFGLEEVWENDNTTQPQNSHSSFHVIGRYFGGSTCLFFGPLVSGVPYTCPTNRGDPVTITNTTHPDQHAALFIPHTDGSDTLVVGNDGGIYTQTAKSGTDYDNDHWGKGANQGFATLFPYDAVIADDGTAWMGLQDNGSAKITDVKDKSGTVLQHQRQIETIGGDGFFVGTDPRNSNVAYEEYVYGAMSGTSDGGKSWNGMAPPNMSSATAQFSNPFVVDALNPLHVYIAGNQVNETGSGPATSTSDWAVDYHLGTAKHPGDGNATPSSTDPANVDSAIDAVGANVYVGYCGSCDVLNVSAPFKSGLATNVGGTKPAKEFSSDGWHVAKAVGLPNRYITAIKVDPTNPKTVYVSVGGYRRPWTPPGLVDKNKKVGKGHLFVSHDAGAHFTDISANLPNYPVNWVTLRGSQVVVGTDVGIFISNGAGKPFQVLGKGLPVGQIGTVRVNPCDPNELVTAVFGRGVYLYRFGPVHHCPPLPPPLPPPALTGKTVAGPFTFEGSTDGWVDKSTKSPGWQNQPPGSTSTEAMAVSPYQPSGSGTPISYALWSPKMSLPDRSSVKITWDVRQDTEPGFDYLALQWSSSGFVWTSVGSSTSGQNKDFPNYTTNTATFVAPKGDLYIRFVLTSDELVATPPYTGAWVDNVKVER